MKFRMETKTDDPDKKNASLIRLPLWSNLKYLLFFCNKKAGIPFKFLSDCREKRWDAYTNQLTNINNTWILYFKSRILFLTLVY